METEYGLEVDIWALGVVVRELAEGMAPYYANFAEQAETMIVEYGIPEFNEPGRDTMISF
jgi:hypothetical protein